VACLVDTPLKLWRVSQTRHKMWLNDNSRAATPHAPTLSLYFLSRQDPPPHGKTQLVCISLSLSLSSLALPASSAQDVGHPQPPKTTNAAQDHLRLVHASPIFLFFCFQLYIQYLYICLIYVK
jgi:hypothetical protein